MTSTEDYKEDVQRSRIALLAVILETHSEFEVSIGGVWYVSKMTPSMVVIYEDGRSCACGPLITAHRHADDPRCWVEAAEVIDRLWRWRVRS